MSAILVAEEATAMVPGSGVGPMVGRYRERLTVNGSENFRLYGNDHEASQSIYQIGLDGGEVSIVSAFIESNALEGRFAHNFG